jgi:hypothetical protein
MIRSVRASLVSMALVGALAAGAALPAHADCTFPRAPAALPDGNTATMEEMVAGQQTVKKYMADMDVYLKCLDDEKVSMPEKPTDDQKKEYERQEAIRVQKHNAAVGDMEGVAGKFNEQLKSFRARQAKKN